MNKDNHTDTPPKDIESLNQERVRSLIAEGARLLAAKRPGEAITKLSEAWELDPGNIATAINLGGAYILQGKHGQAVPILEEATRRDPENVMIWSNLAAAYLGKLPFASREMQDKAIEAYHQALSLDPKAPHAHYNLGLIYLERDDPIRASAHFSGALESDPTDRDAQLWLDRIQQAAPDEPLPPTD